MPKTRAELVEEILGHYDEPEEDNDFDPACDNRYLLVEQSSRYRGRRWFTWHDTMKGAAVHHLADECREDWDMLDLWDTQTGQQFEPVFSLEWIAGGGR